MANEKNKCKACGKDIRLADSFCPHCGYEQHILPEEISDEVKKKLDEYEGLRLKAWKIHDRNNQGTVSPRNLPQTWFSRYSSYIIYALIGILLAVFGYRACSTTSDITPTPLVKETE